MGIKNIIGELHVNGSKVVTEDTMPSRGLSIKTITFTDKPSVLAWVQSNATKVIRTCVTSSQFAAPIFFTDVFVDTNELTFTRFDSVGTFSGTGTRTIELSATELMMSQDGDTTFCTGYLNTETPLNAIPDEYWSVLELTFTFYYIE